MFAASTVNSMTKCTVIKREHNTGEPVFTDSCNLSPLAPPRTGAASAPGSGKRRVGQRAAGCGWVQPGVKYLSERGGDFPTGDTLVIVYYRS